MSICNRCKQPFEQTHFNQKYCIECRPIVLKEIRKRAEQKWLKDHKEQRKAIRKNYYLKHSWYDMKPEEKAYHLERKRKAYWENPELAKEKNREWYKNWVSTERGKILHNQSNYRRRTKEKLIVHQFTPEQWQEKLVATQGICSRCNRKVGIENMELDHIIPISKAKKGHIYTINDVQPLCRGCNRSKGDK